MEGKGPPGSPPAGTESVEQKELKMNCRVVAHAMRRKLCKLASEFEA